MHTDNPVIMWITAFQHYADYVNAIILAVGLGFKICVLPLYSHYWGAFWLANNSSKTLPLKFSLHLVTQSSCFGMQDGDFLLRLFAQFPPLFCSSRTPKRKKKRKRKTYRLGSLETAIKLFCWGTRAHQSAVAITTQTHQQKEITA